MATSNVVITQQASLAPALPVMREPISPTFPKSSAPACTTKLLSNIPSPVVVRSTAGALIKTGVLAEPSACGYVIRFPKSPGCLTVSVGPPWFKPFGLK